MSKILVERLGNVCKVINGRAYKQSELLEKGKYKVLRVGNFFTNNSWYYSDLELKEDKYCEYGDLLFAWSASFGPWIWEGDKTIYHYHIWKMVVDNEKIDKMYLYYYLLIKTKSFMASTHGSIMLHLTKSFMEDLVITFPENISNQKAIAKTLVDLDKKIALNNQINHELEAMAKLLYDYWFVQFDFPNEEGKPYKSSGGKMIYNEELKREIPEGWDVGTFGDYAKVKSGFAFKSSWWKERGVPVIKIKDIQEDYTLNLTDLSFVNNDKAELAKNYICKAGDIVIAMTGATIGKFAVIPKTDCLLLVNQRVGLYNLGKEPFEKLPYFINSMKQEFFRLKIFQVATGAAQPNISGAQLDSFPLVKPIDSIIIKYNEMMKDNHKMIAKNILENQHLTELRDWLLPMLMNGQVKVKNTAKVIEKEMDRVLEVVAEPNVKY